MGSEILDSSRGTRSVVPTAVEPTADATMPVVELDELQPLRLDPATGPGRGPRRRLRLVGYLRDLRNDPPRRRTTIRTVAVCLLLMALTASIVQFRAQRQISAEESGRVAVDVRLDEVRPASRSFDLNGAPANGSVTARVEMHNVGPAEVRLVGLDVTSGSRVQTVNDVSRTATALGPGRTSDTTYNIELPCTPAAQRALGSPELTARVRTSDGQVHPVPVNMSQVNQEGGLLVACVDGNDDLTTRPINNYESTTDGTTVAMTITTNVGGQLVALVTPNIGAQVRFSSVPQLPVSLEAGVPMAIKIRPIVTQCPRSPINFDVLQGFGLTIGTEQLSDPYLPTLVAQAVGRACGQRR